MAFSTAAQLINDAAVELGLQPTDLTDPFDSADAAIKQLCRLSKRVGRTLVRAFPWSQLQKTHTFNTAAATAQYALPADFDRFVDQTGWNRANDAPMYGPVGAAEWQRMQALTTTSVYSFFRMYGNYLNIYPTPTAIAAHAFEYISSYWVMPTGQTAPTTDAATDGADTIWFDSSMFVSGLKLSWKREKGFDTTAAQQDFNEDFGRACGADGAAPVLSLNGWSDRFLYAVNIPEGSWG